MTILAVVAELFSAGGRTDRHDEVNNPSPQLCGRDYK
jgi:hypothetical protein